MGKDDKSGPSDAFNKLKLNHPPPRSAVRTYSPAIARTLATPAPSGPVPSTPDREPQPATSSPAKRGPAQEKHDPAREKLEDEAKKRRVSLQKEESGSREGQRREHAENDQMLRDRQARKSGIQGVAAEQERLDQAAAQASELQIMDEYFADRWTTLEAEIAEAFETGHFTDEWAASAERAAGWEIDRGDDGIGRELED